MDRIAVNAAFHRLVSSGLSPDRAWMTLVDALQNGDLNLWCDGNPVKLPYLRGHLRFDVIDGDLKVGPAGPLGWVKPPDDYAFEVLSEQIERLTERRGPGRPRESVTSEAVKAERTRRLKAKLPVGQKHLAIHFGVSPTTIARRLKK